MNKVYILFKEQGAYDDFHSEIHAIYSKLESAEKEKQRIENNIELLKSKYTEQFNSTMKKDSGSLKDFKIDRYYKFKRENPEVEIHTVYIQEHTVI